jgi:plasmid stabilization system protein ParE
VTPTHKGFIVSTTAARDLLQIWCKIAEDSGVETADRIERQIKAKFDAIGQRPGIGHTRKDFTKRPLLFFPIQSWLILYRAGPKPITIVAVLHGARNIRAILRNRRS